MSNEPIHDLEPDISIDLSDLEGFPTSPVPNNTARRSGNADLALTAEQRQQSLDVLRRVVRQNWVVGGLCNSLHNELMVRLDIQQEGNVMYPSLWTMIYQQEGQDDREFDDTEALVDVFTQSERSMVILGADGVGKTTTLLQIAEALSEPTDEAEQLNPVIFNLATWRDKFPAFSVWLVHQLVEIYYIPEAAARDWIFNNELVVLLDGLDEVDDDHRASCVQAINEFRQAHSVGIAVSCQTSTYEALVDAPLALNGKLWIHPYTAEEIVEYIDDGGEHLSGLSPLLADNWTLGHAAQTPFFLTIMSLVFSAQPELLTDTPRRAERSVREHIIDLYIRQMLRAEPIDQLYGSQVGSIRPHFGAADGSLKRLRWLASRMEANNRSIFQLELLQKRGFLDMFTGLLRTPVTWLISASYLVATGFLFQWVGFGPLAGIFFGMVFAYILSTESILKDARSLPASVNVLRGRQWQQLLGFVPVLAFFGFIIGFPFIAFGLFAVVIIAGILFLFSPNGAVHVHAHRKRNQGTWLSLYSGLATGASIMLVAGFALGLTYWIALGHIGWFLQGLLIGLIMGLVGGLVTGFHNCIAHLVARLFARLLKKAPWSYARFLDYAASRLFLRKIGGNYIFTHPILQDHIAKLSNEDIAWITENQ